MGSTARALYERVTKTSEAVLLWLLGIGVAQLAWVAALAGALGATVTSLWPTFALHLHPKYGPGAFVLACVVGGYTFLFFRARSLAEGDTQERFASATGALRRVLTPLLLALVVITVSRGLEREHPFIVLTLAGFSGWAASSWLAAWKTPEGDFAWQRWLRAQRDESIEVSGVALRRATANSPSALVTLVALVLGYTVVMSLLAINNHLAFNTGRADLGFYVSIFRRSSLGDLLGCTICGGGNHLSGHFDPVLVLLSPIYWVYPEAETVLVLQSLLLGSTMIPLYLIARRLGLGSGVALALCGCFALHPALHGVNLFDFHSLALVIPVGMWLLWARECGRGIWYWVIVGLFLTIREDAALILVIIGADSILSHKRFGLLRGLGTMLIGVGYFLFVKGVILNGADPLNPGTGRGYAYYYQDLVPKGTGTLGLVNTVLSTPSKVIPLLLQEQKVQYWATLLVPLLGLPLLARRGRLLLFYGAAFTLLASREYVYSVHFHYSSVILPFLFYLSAIALSTPRRLARRIGWWWGARSVVAGVSVLAVSGALASTAVASWRFGGMLPNRTFHAGFKPLARKPNAADLERDKILKQVCRLIPKDAKVAANEPNLPHLGRCAGYLGKGKRHLGEYLIWNFTHGAATDVIEQEIKKGYWEEVRSFAQGFKLFKNRMPKGYVPAKLPNGRPGRPATRRPTPPGKAPSHEQDAGN
ncbi:MAG TPA: DUF2079 domain-containing protein [Polyangiaceae bacterium]|jgi:uncharacterized membrane protein|nr:DUF2079 domain-containing protein [Polyangiaceae bacterium]